MSTPGFRWSVRGVIENLCQWANDRPVAAIIVLALLVLAGTMFVVVARWDRREKEDRNRRL